LVVDNAGKNKGRGGGDLQLIIVGTGNSLPFKDGIDKYVNRRIRR
jgi:hypothetical protein